MSTGTDSTTTYFVTVHAKGGQISGTVLGDRGPHDVGAERFHDWLLRMLGTSSSFALPLIPEGTTVTGRPITVYVPPGVAVTINSAVDGFARVDPQTGARALPAGSTGGGGAAGALPAGIVRDLRGPDAARPAAAADPVRGADDGQDDGPEDEIRVVGQ